MPPSVKTLEELLQLASTRQRRFAEQTFVSSIARGEVLADPHRRNVILACARRFSSNFQTLLFARQALCEDGAFYPAFLRHLNEELGHDKLLEGEGSPEPIEDTVFEAVLAWFAYQMMVLDNAEKAALMHLVLEAAGDQFHVIAAPHLRDQVRSGYFDVHAELDSEHASMGGGLLGGFSARTYERLGVVVDRGWDMMEATFERVRQLVEEREPTGRNRDG